MPSSSDKIYGLPQVSRDHYLNPRYLSNARFLGLKAQLEACTSAAAAGDSFLEIGPGIGLLSALLRHLGYPVVTTDLAADLVPMVVSRLPEIPLASRSVSFACAFEVLEHVPLDLLIPCLKEMARVASKGILFSVPSQQEIYASRSFLHLVLGKRKLYLPLAEKKLNRLTNPEEHYWEIGFAGITVDRILQRVREAGLPAAKTQFVSPWFQMFSIVW